MEKPHLVTIRARFAIQMCVGNQVLSLCRRANFLFVTGCSWSVFGASVSSPIAAERVRGDFESDLSRLAISVRRRMRDESGRRRAITVGVLSSFICSLVRVLGS